MMHEHILEGCNPTPLASYLKALGILRLVAEQKDAKAAGRWEGEQFVLRSTLSTEELERFFLDEYRPSPIVAPWNGGSGFYAKDNKIGIVAIANAKTSRLELYQQVIEQTIAEVRGREESPKDDEKAEFLSRVRSRLPDAALTWFDAAVMLAAQRPGYPPLLGTGGNDGRLDFTNNFMQRLVEVIDPADGKPTKTSHQWLVGALYGKAICGLIPRAIGQFSPGSAGGPNATAGFASASFVNPWDFVLMLEGSLLFAGAATRRLNGSDVSGLSYPLTVRTTGSGTGAGSMADEGSSRAEIWMPLWGAYIGVSEMTLLFAEARVTLGRRPVRDGLSFARAVCSYGTDRGIMAFQRFGFLMRSGKAYLATPLTRFLVRRRPSVELLRQLDDFAWLDRLRSFARSDRAPGRLRQLVRRLEDAIFALTQFGGRQEVQRILILLGQVQQACAVSIKAREAVSPIPWLSHEWVQKADDQTHEFRIACALAGLSDMRGFLVPQKKDKGRIQWDLDSRKAVWAAGDLVSNLLQVLDRRLLEAQRGESSAGREPADRVMLGSKLAGYASIAAFLRKETDDERTAALLNGLVNVKIQRGEAATVDESSDLPAADFTVLKPFFTPAFTLRRLGLLAEGESLPIPRQILALLRTDDPTGADRAVSAAWRRLRIAGFPLPSQPSLAPTSLARNGARLAAALMIPLEMRDLGRIAQLLKRPQETR
jgi:CRISPR-associated protein Csx17